MKQKGFLLILLHLAGWLIFLSLPVAFIVFQSGNTAFLPLLGSFAFWAFAIFFILFFYLHTYLLLPLFIHPKGWIWYTMLILVLACAVIYWQPFEHLMRSNMRPDMNMPRMPPPGVGRPPGPGQRGNMHRGLDIISVVLFLMATIISITLDISRRWRITTRKMARAEADRAEAELSFLRSQINPHFLFNTLNNIYSLAVTGSSHTADSILKLSNIMRYVTDETQESTVSLQSEIDCLTDYIDLQRLRLGKKVSLHFSITGDIEFHHIAPLVLMSFVENVFKYGISNHASSELFVQLEVTDSLIRLRTQNPIFPFERTGSRFGIGIANTRKRLEHLYPGRHRLMLTRENGIFTVVLELDTVRKFETTS
jgi:hypothetical protein